MFRRRASSTTVALLPQSSIPSSCLVALLQQATLTNTSTCFKAGPKKPRSTGGGRRSPKKPNREKWLVNGGRATRPEAGFDSFFSPSVSNRGFPSSIFDDPFFTPPPFGGGGGLLSASHFREMQSSFDRMDRLFGEVENMFQHQQQRQEATPKRTVIQNPSDNKRDFASFPSHAGAPVFSSRSISTTSEIRGGKRYTKRITKVREASGEQKENVEEFVTDLQTDETSKFNSQLPLALPPPDPKNSEPLSVEVSSPSPRKKVPSKTAAKVRMTSKSALKRSKPKKRG